MVALPVTLNEFPENTLAFMLALASRTTTVLATAGTLVSYPSSKSAFRFVTSVVLATVNGAVPVTTLLCNLEADTKPVMFAFPPVILPVTSNDISVPTEVKLEPTTVAGNDVPVRVCALAVTVPLPPRVILVPLTVRLLFANLAWSRVPVEMLLALSAVSAEPLPLTLVNAPVVPETLPVVTLPVTASDPNVPTEVKLLVTTVLFKVVPVSVPAAAVIVLVPPNVSVLPLTVIVLLARRA